MQNDDVHLSDAELIQFADGEISGREARRLDDHLTACWQCRARRAELERTIADYVRIHDAGSENLPPMDESRARLLAQLVQLSAAPPAPQQPTRVLRNLAYGVAACLILGFGIVMYFSVVGAGADSVPDEQLTPGATRAVTREDICKSDAFEGFYPIPDQVAFNVFENYQIQNPSPRSYEVDYLITPGLGGAEDIRNLWPQPYGSGEWTAHVKDALEAHLHDLVCTGGLDLETAQRDIARNWITAYRKYFKTHRPLQQHIAFRVDPPWEY